MLYYVYRERHWPSGDQIVEVVCDDEDVSPDKLVSKWKNLGEGRRFIDPREAVSAAIKIAEAWRLVSDEPVHIGVGSFTSATVADAEAWAEKV